MNETMTDRELDAWLAEHLLGWEWRVGTASNSNQWEAFLVPPEQTDERKSTGRLFYATPQAGVGHDLNSAPNLSSTGEGMLSVLSALRDRGFGASIVAREAGNWNVMIATDKDMDWLTDDRAAESPSLPRAVAEAAKEALESEA